MYQSEATRSVLFDDVKPPSICYQKPLRGRPGRWMRISLKHLEHDFPAGSTLEVEPGEGYAVWRRGLRGHNWIRPDINFRGRLSVPVQVRSPIPNAPLHGTFISNTYFLKVSVDTKMKWLFPAVLGGEILLDDAD
jgi:hypothetical protein